MFQNKMFKHGNSIDLLGKNISCLIIEWITSRKQTNKPNKKTQQVIFSCNIVDYTASASWTAENTSSINKLPPCQYSQGVKQWE